MGVQSSFHRGSRNTLSSTKDTPLNALDVHGCPVLLPSGLQPFASGMLAALGNIQTCLACRLVVLVLVLRPLRLLHAFAARTPAAPENTETCPLNMLLSMFPCCLKVRPYLYIHPSWTLPSFYHHLKSWRNK